MGPTPDRFYYKLYGDVKLMLTAVFFKKFLKEYGDEKNDFQQISNSTKSQKGWLTIKLTSVFH